MRVVTRRSRVNCAIATAALESLLSHRIAPSSTQSLQPKDRDPIYVGKSRGSGGDPLQSKGCRGAQARDSGASRWPAFGGVDGGGREGTGGRKRCVPGQAHLAGHLANVPCDAGEVRPDESSLEGRARSTREITEEQR
jgi:hypothetical protein